MHLWPDARVSREEKILAIAQREVDPRHVSEFAPITRGPIFAALAMIGLGIVAGFYVAGRKVRGAGGPEGNPGGRSSGI
jgi:hypothetical protein